MLLTVIRTDCIGSVLVLTPLELNPADRADSHDGHGCAHFSIIGGIAIAAINITKTGSICHTPYIATIIHTLRHQMQLTASVKTLLFHSIS